MSSDGTHFAYRNNYLLLNDWRRGHHHWIIGISSKAKLNAISPDLSQIEGTQQINQMQWILCIHT